MIDLGISTSYILSNSCVVRSHLVQTSWSPLYLSLLLGYLDEFCISFANVLYFKSLSKDTYQIFFQIEHLSCKEHWHIGLEAKECRSHLASHRIALFGLALNCKLIHIYWNILLHFKK